MLELLGGLEHRRSHDDYVYALGLSVSSITAIISVRFCVLIAHRILSLFQLIYCTLAKQAQVRFPGCPRKAEVNCSSFVA